ncbi:MAG: branched-chain amino acid ABC transporter permease [Deltaproteobacteria bacterium]|nr:branched-chain amino acid ABC transporter permease [Deltaproteobacteria bacterium]
MGTLIGQALVNGILLGGIYAAFSAGFSLIFGVMGVVNLAHGELVMVGAFITYWIFYLFGFDPFLTIPVSFAVLFALGYLLQRFIINRVIEEPPIMSYLVTFGIHLVIANVALLWWTADFRTVTSSYSGINFSVAGLVVPCGRLATFGIALVMVGLLYCLVHKTDMGLAIQATAQDKQMARLVGIDVARVYAMTFGLGAGITGLSGSLVSTYFVIFPFMGMEYTLIAFCVVVLGGMGYIPGALIGGMILGVLQSFTATFLSAGLSMALTFVVLFAALVVRPAGIVGRGIVE